MKFVKDRLSLNALKELAGQGFGNMVKAVVDVERDLVVLDGELHSDLEALLLQDGSKQENLWGINLYPDASGEELIEFDSMINLRPTQGNRSRGVENETVRKKIGAILSKIIS